MSLRRRHELLVGVRRFAWRRRCHRVVIGCLGLASCEQSERAEADEKDPGYYEEAREQAHPRELISLVIVVDVGLHRLNERLVVRQASRDLLEDADVVAHQSDQAVEVLLHCRQVLQDRLFAGNWAAMNACTWSGVMFIASASAGIRFWASTPIAGKPCT